MAPAPRAAQPTDVCRVIHVTSANRAPAAAEAGRVVRAGGVIAFPTETVYGVGASADREDGLAKLCALKGRDAGKPIALLLSDFRHAARYAREPSRLSRRLAAAFCPGPITLVLPARGTGTVGLRVPSHPVALAIVDACGGALYATSANRSGLRPARSAQEVLDALADGLDLVLDAGPSRIGTASTVVRVDGDEYDILRPGAIAEKQIAAAARRPTMNDHEQ